MALPVPAMDHRDLEVLLDDAQRTLRRHCPEWTDHHPSDPGVALVEAMAVLIHELVGQLNEIPDRLYLAFLELIGVRLMPATPARTDITFWLSAPAETTMTVEGDTEVSTLRTESTEAIVFTTEHDVDVVPCRLASVATRVTTRTSSTSTDRWQELVRATSFPAFAPQPAPGDELLVGLDNAVGSCVVRLEIEARMEGLGVDPRHVPLVWEAWTTAGWTACEVYEDGTGGLNTAGSVVLLVPRGHRTSSIEGRQGGWLRARVLEPEEGQRGYSAPPTIGALTATTIGATGSAVHARIVDNELLGRAEGVPGQRFALTQAPALAGLGDLVVETTSREGWQEWTPVEHFAASGADDRHVLLDVHAGEIRFGPAVRLPDGGFTQYGAVPALGESVRVRRYAVGGGPVGNVGAGTIRTLRSSIPFVAAVENRRSARGGTPAETLEQARDRGPLSLRTRSRAVTAEDYEALSRDALPDAARVRCITAGDAEDVPAGTVKVLVVPQVAMVADEIRFADLVPGQDMLERLADHLESVRLVGTRVVVSPPRYRGVTVVARLVARTRVPTDRVQAEAMTALLRYLNPLPGGGPDGSGWPFGRAVRQGDVHAVLARVAGVDYVEDVRLFAANPLTGERGAERTRIDVDANSLVFSFDHRIRVESSAPEPVPEVDET